MEISTVPSRWPDLQNKEPKDEEREQRASRTNVTRLDYLDSGEVVSNQYKSSKALRDALTGESTDNDADKRQFRLFVVEDLSRDVIELLGSNLDIEPAFFREHIFDYAWYNTRDRWADPPSLNIVTRQNRWVPIRFVTARYFKTPKSFMEGFKEAASFNVLRRLDDDQNGKSMWDDKEAIVGIIRTRASFWFKSTENQNTSESQTTSETQKMGASQNGAVGRFHPLCLWIGLEWSYRLLQLNSSADLLESPAVLLVDPTIKAGVPLWYGYRNWEATPKMDDPTPVGPPRDSLYNDLIYWAKRPGAFKTLLSDNSALNKPNSNNPTLNHYIAIQALLYIICAEWLTMADYIKTRLGQIEWEISFPEHFLKKYNRLDDLLNKLHIWKRLVPLYREELTETLQRVFHFPCHTTNPISSGNASNQCQCALQNPAPFKRGSIYVFRDDFIRALSYMEEYQQDIHRLSSNVTAIITMRAAEAAIADNKNLERLTGLATFFIPLSFVAALFSMQSDVTQLGPTFILYAKTAFPLAALVLFIGLVIIPFIAFLVYNRQHTEG
jgi:Mg2+ and Co2+ transporter CorA